MSDARETEFGPFDEALDRAQADGKVSADDADTVREFAEFLGKLPPHADRSSAAFAQRRRALVEHYELCGFTPEEAESIRTASVKIEEADRG